MTDRPLSDDELEQFHNHRYGASPSKSGDDKLPGQGAIETLGAFGQGVGKALASMGAPPGGKSLEDVDPKGPVASWAKSEQTEHPWAETAGRWAGEYGPLAALPDIGGPRLAGAGLDALARAAPRLTHIAERGLQGAWKGAVGGQTQGDASTGAAFGGGSAAGLTALRSIPQAYLLPAAVLAGGGLAAGGRYIPWDLRHVLSYLSEAALAGGGAVPGVTGAIGARMFGSGGDGEEKQQ